MYLKFVLWVGRVGKALSRWSKEQELVGLMFYVQDPAAPPQIPAPYQEYYKNDVTGGFSGIGKNSSFDIHTY